MSTEDMLRKSIRKSLGLPERTPGQNNKKKNLNEAYVVEPKRFQLKTEFMSEKAKRARLDDFEQFVKSLNEISAKLDTASREDADRYSSDFRSLKVDEVHCLNASFLRALRRP